MLHHIELQLSDGGGGCCLCAVKAAQSKPLGETRHANNSDIVGGDRQRQAHLLIASSTPTKRNRSMSYIALFVLERGAAASAFHRSASNNIIAAKRRTREKCSVINLDGTCPSLACIVRESNMT